MQVQFEGGNKMRAGSISLGSACSLECGSAGVRALCYNTRSSLLPAVSTAVSGEISAVASVATTPDFAVHRTILRAAV